MVSSGQPANDRTEDLTRPSNLSDLLLASPLAEVNLHLGRSLDYARPVDLGVKRFLNPWSPV